MDDTANASHYDAAGLADRITAALAASGLTGRSLSARELAPLDQFHTRGMVATIELAEAAAIKPGDRVLDVGSGLGGPSRTLAATVGCHVVGIDITPSFVEAARLLSDLAGLTGKTRYDCANALTMPFDDAGFDVAWSQHVAMNIADRAGLYKEVRRVLKPGGRFAIYDVVALSGEPLHFPVPWSADPATSHLLTADAMRDALVQQGFRLDQWTDRTAEGIAWVKQLQADRARGPTTRPILGLHLAMGPGFPAMSANLARNLLEGRIGLREAVLTKSEGTSA